MPTTRSRRSSKRAEGTLPLAGYDPQRDARGFRFERELAERALGFIEGACCHVKGALAGQPIRLEKWQRGFIAALFGWVDPYGFRRYREAFVGIPRKNAKTTLVASLANYMLFCDGEGGAEVYAAAGDEGQARLLFEVAREQVLRQKTLARHAEVLRGAIVLPRLGSSFKPITAEASTKHGFNAHAVFVDELHAQPNRELVDVLETSMGARRQPLMCYLTTSDFSRPSICNEKWDYARNVRDGIIRDARFLPIIYEAASDSEWQSPKVWRAANPNLGVSISREYLERAAEKAATLPSYENTFKRLHLNIRTEQDVRWLPLELWESTRAAPRELAGRACFGGLDLSTTTDLSALVLAFPSADGFDVLARFWAPEEGATRREVRDRVPYLQWAKEGHLQLTPGAVVDYDRIRTEILALAKMYNIRGIAIDRWNATQLASQLDAEGLPVVFMGQGYASLSAPAKELEALVSSARLRVGGHPVLDWMAANVAVEQDAAGNIKPSKKRSTERIDGIVALVMALGLAISDAEGPSVYETSGLDIFEL